jgi:hypothetical protein
MITAQFDGHMLNDEKLKVGGVARDRSKIGPYDFAFGGNGITKVW